MWPDASHSASPRKQTYSVWGRAGGGCFPSSRTAIISRLWRCTKRNWRALRIMDLPRHPPTGHARRLLCFILPVFWDHLYPTSNVSLFTDKLCFYSNLSSQSLIATSQCHIFLPCTVFIVLSLIIYHQHYLLAVLKTTTFICLYFFMKH